MLKKAKDENNKYLQVVLRYLKSEHQSIGDLEDELSKYDQTLDGKPISTVFDELITPLKEEMEMYLKKQIVHSVKSKETVMDQIKSFIELKRNRVGSIRPQTAFPPLNEKNLKEVFMTVLSHIASLESLIGIPFDDHNKLTMVIDELVSEFGADQVYEEMELIQVC